MMRSPPPLLVRNQPGQATRRPKSAGSPAARPSSACDSLRPQRRELRGSPSSGSVLSNSPSLGSCRLNGNSSHGSLRQFSSNASSMRSLLDSSRPLTASCASTRQPSEISERLSRQATRADGVSRQRSRSASPARPRRPDNLMRIDELTIAIKERPADVSLYIARADAYEGARQWRQVLYDLAMVCHLEPNVAAHHRRRAEVHKLLGDVTRCLSEYDRALKVASVHSGAKERARLHAARAAVRGGAGMLAEELEDLSAALLLVPYKPSFAGERQALLRRRGACRRLAGAHAQAAADLHAALAIDAADVQALQELARVALERGDGRGAEEVAARAVAAAPKDASVHAQMAAALQLQNRLEEAAAALQLAMELAPRVPGYAVSLGEVHALRGKHEMALSSFEKASALATPLLEASRAKVDSMEEAAAAARRRRGRREEEGSGPPSPNLKHAAMTEEALEQATLEAKTAESAAELDKWRQVVSAAALGAGRVLLSLHRVDEAERHFEAAMRALPSCVEARLELATLLFRRDAVAEALDELDSCVALQPDLVAARRQRANLRFYVGQFANALEDSLVLEDLDGGALRPTDWLLRAEALLATRRPHDALAFLDDVKFHIDAERDADHVGSRLMIVRAEIFRALQRYKDAFEQLDRAEADLKRKQQPPARCQSSSKLPKKSSATERRPDVLKANDSAVLSKRASRSGMLTEDAVPGDEDLGHVETSLATCAPLLGRLHEVRAGCLHEVRQYSAALEEYSVAIGARSGGGGGEGAAALILLRACSLYSLKRWEEAESDCRAAIAACASAGGIGFEVEFPQGDADASKHTGGEQEWRTRAAAPACASTTPSHSLQSTRRDAFKDTRSSLNGLAFTDGAQPFEHVASRARSLSPLATPPSARRLAAAAQQLLGLSLSRQGLAWAGVAALSASIALGDADGDTMAHARMQRGTLLLLLNRATAAITDLDAAIANSLFATPIWSLAHHRRGLAHTKLRDFETAARDLEIAARSSSALQVNYYAVGKQMPLDEQNVDEGWEPAAEMISLCTVAEIGTDADADVDDTRSNGDSASDRAEDSGNLDSEGSQDSYMD